MVFLGIGFGQNSKLETDFCFLFFLVFFGIGLGQHSKLETGYLGFFGIFLVFEFRVKKTKKPKKNQDKPVATPKLVNWLIFLVFLG